MEILQASPKTDLQMCLAAQDVVTDEILAVLTKVFKTPSSEFVRGKSNANELVYSRTLRVEGHIVWKDLPAPEWTAKRFFQEVCTPIAAMLKQKGMDVIKANPKAPWCHLSKEITLASGSVIVVEVIVRCDTFANRKTGKISTLAPIVLITLSDKDRLRKMQRS